jgi:hypothetical protein
VEICESTEIFVAVEICESFVFPFRPLEVDVQQQVLLDDAIQNLVQAEAFLGPIL